MRKVVFVVVIVVTICCFGHIPQAFSQGCEQAKDFYSEGMALNDRSEQEAEFYRKAIAVCPEYADAHYRLANIYVEWGQYHGKCCPSVPER